MQATMEQTAAVTMFGKGESMVIEAGAGTGKTSTLIMCAASTTQRGQYVAFNKAIVTDAGDRMPENVKARTAHSLAFGAMMQKHGGRSFKARLGGGRVRGDQIARLIGIDPFSIKYGDQAKVLQPGFIASLAQRTIIRFCNTADPTPSWRHVPYVDGIDVPDPTGKRSYSNNDALAQVVDGYLPEMWDDLTDPNGTLPFKHDHYLKMWELDNPYIAADFILFDEAQDASPVMLSIIEQQADHARLIFVGDSQQGIYEWRGAVNALDDAPGADNRTFLTQSFRFGQPIADVANAVLARLGAELRLTGTPGIDSRVERVAEPHCILTRTNALAVETVLKAQKAGKHPILLGGGAEILAFARAAGELMDKGWTTYPDLACFDSWEQVLEYVMHDPQGDELALNVKLVEEYGIDTIRDALERMPRTEQDADLVVSTAHKAKGREWDTVKLGKDFVFRGESDDLGVGEWRLLYVACTRAKFVLDPHAAQPMVVLLGLDGDMEHDEIDTME